MTTLAWLIIIAGILLAITCLGLAIRRREAHSPPRNHDTTPKRSPHMTDLVD